MFIQTVSGFLGTTRHFFLYRLNLQKKFTKDLSKPHDPAHIYCVRRVYSSSSDISLIESSMVGDYYSYWNILEGVTESVKYRVRYHGNIYVYTNFIHKPCLSYCEMLILAFIRMLEVYAYQIRSSYVKVTLGYTVRLPNKTEFSYTLGPSIPLFDLSGALIQRRMVYDQIERQVREHSEQYEKALVMGVFMNIYYEKRDSPSEIEFPDIPIERFKEHIRRAMNSEILSEEYPEAASLLTKPSRIPSNIKALKGNEIKERRPFIVADIETVMLDGVQVPYAAGYLSVKPGDDLTTLPSYSINTFFSEDHISMYSDFEERSKSMFYQFCSNMESCVQKSVGKVRTIYFHNLGSFDGLFLLNYYVSKGNRYKIKPLIRNHKVYELKVYLDGKLLMRFRDSYILLPGSLSSLGKTLCPELGDKGSIPHDDLVVSDLLHMKSDLLDYLRQDIRLLGGVMLKAQDINWNKYQIDVEDVMTVSALSLKIFRKKYFDENAFHINIPNRNQDSFIRSAYYGGHVDVYKPYGDNLFYYDVNSLYPYIMKTYPMPSGPPVWHKKLAGLDLENLYGFIEAYVVCPPSIERPFLPYKDAYGTLIFPTGKFTGVYFSEELKFAKTLGYEIIPLRGYLFEKKPSPFKGIIEDLYESRLDAKKKGDDAMSYIYKILMNSLYGRFGINPESTVTEICKEDRYMALLRKDNFESAEQLNETYYMVKYRSNYSLAEDDDWKAPKMSAVHLAAAITACARIHMYPHISRPDCIYIDTDSIVLSSPLSEDFISSKEMGLYKLEYKVKKGIFLAPKSYMLKLEDGTTIIKHKGVAKDMVTAEWFERQYADPTLVEELTKEDPFRRDWKNLQICKKEIHLRLGLPKNTKRENVYDSNNVWVNTRPIEVLNVGSEDANIILKYELTKEKGVSVSQSTTEEGKKTYTQESTPTLYTYKPNKKTMKKLKAKAKKDNDNSSPGRPKPDS